MSLLISWFSNIDPRVSNINHMVYIPKSIMVNHDAMSHYDKYCLNMKINHGQQCLFFGL